MNRFVPEVLGLRALLARFYPRPIDSALLSFRTPRMLEFHFVEASATALPSA